MPLPVLSCEVRVPRLECTRCFLGCALHFCCVFVNPPPQIRNPLFYYLDARKSGSMGVYYSPKCVSLALQATSFGAFAYLIPFSTNSLPFDLRNVSADFLSFGFFAFTPVGGGYYLGSRRLSRTPSFTRVSRSCLDKHTSFLVLGASRLWHWPATAPPSFWQALSAPPDLDTPGRGTSYSLLSCVEMTPHSYHSVPSTVRPQPPLCSHLCA